MLRALIVEDDRECRATLIDLVRQQGFEAAGVSTLREARGHLRRTPPDLLLTDLGLPDGNGMELLEEIDPDAGIEVVMVTGDERLQTAREALSRGAADYLIKPIDARRLKVVLFRVCRRS